MKPLGDLARAIKEFPQYAFYFIVSLVIAMLTDSVITMLTIGAVCLGKLTDALTASTVFAFVYVIIRAINTVANAIGVTGSRVANGLAGIAHPSS
jgi:hypothetical protein